jgi:hypothetical protein
MSRCAPYVAGRTAQRKRDARRRSVATTDQTDVSHLRRCVELARTARQAGNEPFGSLLVGGDGSVLLELMNTTGNGDVTGHSIAAVEPCAYADALRRSRRHTSALALGVASRARFDNARSA